MELVVFENEWWWGHSTTFITTDGKATVVLSVRKDSPEWGYISSFMVHDSVRRQGIGTALMKETEERARQKGLKYLYLQADKSKFVKEWYERLGFVDKGDAEDTEGHDVQMQKEL